MIGKTKFFDDKKEVLSKMTMFDKVGVGTDWIEIKRQKDEAVHEKAIEMGLSPEQAAKLADHFVLCIILCA